MKHLYNTKMYGVSDVLESKIYTIWQVDTFTIQISNMIDIRTPTVKLLDVKLFWDEH